MSEVVVIGSPSDGNLELVAGLERVGVDVARLGITAAADTLEPGDVALVRLDVLPTLDGIEPGLDVLPQLEFRGVRVLNRTGPLLAAHDKLRTAALLEPTSVPHPRTQHLFELWEVLALGLPVVLKPRFGSWGEDVFRCETVVELRRAVRELHARAWFHRHGVLAQELLGSPGYDLRLLVAGGEVVGAAQRRAAAGEWRTNVSVGGTLHSVVPTDDACALGIAAANALGTDFAGVDLLPTDAGYVVLELNAAVDFCDVYSLPGRNVYADLAAALEIEALAPVK